MTGNASGQVGAAVTCYGCENNWNEATSRAEAYGGHLHCTHCHKDGHRACVVCGSCIAQPDRYGRVFQHRWDKFYCSSTCRVKAIQLRQDEQAHRAEWEAEHPEEAAKERAEREVRDAELERLAKIELMLLDPKRAAMIEKRKQEDQDGAARDTDLQERAERCAHVEHVKVGERPFNLPGMNVDVMAFTMPVFKSVPCEMRFGPADVIYRRYEQGMLSKIMPYCEPHACPQPAGRHNRDCPGGRYYPHCSCPGDEHGDRNWTKAEPCAYCGRLVRNHKEADPHRFTGDWMTPSETEYRRKALAGLSGEEYREAARQLPWGPHEPRTFCSKRCKRAVSRIEAKGKRLAGQKSHWCPVCDREFTGRADARFCSNACRQRAYRERHPTPTAQDGSR